ncbi:lactate utilization protein C [Pontibacter silvestris]|uniref:Lactate utilization protein C n=1 Tax=Pontibacter silvestris TaxID=2305183 RepID=A0ABW4WRD0_9BACT|nr:LUD domain-containing protein [Pontibacter silvestris]MCC9138169.1 LUD domain-containing protein [Pontibacter silvestris]
MSSREQILASVAKNQPIPVALPEIPIFSSEKSDLVEKFTTVAVGIGSKVFRVNSLKEAKQILLKEHKASKRIISTFPQFSDVAEVSIVPSTDPHTMEDVDLAILEAHLGVAENSALWVTEELLPMRVTPFICQHLALVVSPKAILPLMHHAYEQIGMKDYGFGVFIAGPSKTADIEQSLVLGAHGPRTLTIFLLEEQ